MKIKEGDKVEVQWQMYLGQRPPNTIETIASVGIKYFKIKGLKALFCKQTGRDKEGLVNSPIILLDRGVVS